jgi:hypothetical protein
MTRSLSSVAGLGMLACLVAVEIACSTRANEFYAEVFECDTKASQDPCGTTAAGRPMKCFPGGQLGGSNFCAEICDPSQGSDDPAYTCVSSGALLKVCRPDANGAEGCPRGLQCYRTDLLGNDGICLMMRVCAQDVDCSGEAGRICAATLVRSMYSMPGIKADHLQCIKHTCQSGGSQCSDWESCLANYTEQGPEIPDICVPQCDSVRDCPPNFACSISAAAPGSPPICLPGVPGTRCVANQDCVVGNCVDTGAGFSQCTLDFPCQSDSNCAPFNGLASTFVCVEGVPGAPRCMKVQTFAGTDCKDDTGCTGGQRCIRYSPYMGEQANGQCRTPCDVDQACPARGGLPHVCLAGGKGGCYPGHFALPCASSSDCPASLSCFEVSPDERTIISSPTVCTMACATDDDCHASPFIGNNGGFCKEGLCRLAGQKGAPCDRDAQCINSRCVVDGSGIGECAT